MNCDYKIVDGFLVCRNPGCTNKFTYRGIVYRSQCRSGDRQKRNNPGMIRKFLNFSKAATQHAFYGMPKASLAVIQERWKVCIDCELFESTNTTTDEDTGVCTAVSCGCNLTNSARRKLENKLAWADQQCPLGKWGAVPGVNIVIRLVNLVYPIKP